MQTPLLHVTQLCVDFATENAVSKAIQGISFTVEPGEIVAIAGESGSGKSVTALSILQILEKNASVKGQILFKRKDNTITDLNNLPESNMRSVRGNEIAMIFQEPMTSLNPLLTCGYQVMETIVLHRKVSRRIAREKTIEIFKQVRLPEPEKMLGRYPHELSGGQKQRVMIAMAMSCHPLLLIADEPTTALDVTVQKSIVDLIKELQVQNNMSVIFISHDLGLISDLADRVIVMYKGEIAEQGKCQDVLKNPQHLYTKALLACRTTLTNKQLRLPVVNDFLENPASYIQPPTSNIQFSVSNSQHPTILTVNDLCVHYPGKRSFFKRSEAVKAVSHVNFSISRGEIVGLVGESGCGKTTLGRAILNLIKPTSGEIFFNGAKLSETPEKELRALRKELQIVFQDPYGSLNPRLTIGNAILEPIRIHSVYKTQKQQKDRVIELLEKVNLQASHFNRYPHQFSGGQRQRICIARALALNPSLLVFDESVSALDVSVQAQILNLINDLKNEFNFSSLFISHDLSVVHYISDRILVMKSGEIAEEGTSADIYFSPKTEYTKKLIDSIPGKTLPLQS